MPVANWSHIPDLIQELQRANPKTVLDIGVGFGQFGFLVREYLEIWGHGRIKPENWKVELIGVEVCPWYVSAVQESLYDYIVLEDIREYRKREKGQWDLIFIGDVLEHLPKNDAKTILYWVKQRCKHLFIVCPMGNWLRKSWIRGNPHEAHISIWMPSDFQDYCLIGKYKYKTKPYHFYVWRKENDS